MERILPVDWTNETGIMVVIQHDESIHKHTTRCPCVSVGSECDEPQVNYTVKLLNTGSSSQCLIFCYVQVSSCPRLSIVGNTVARGVKAIHDKLRDLNHAVRAVHNGPDHKVSVSKFASVKIFL